MDEKEFVKELEDIISDKELNSDYISVLLDDEYINGLLENIFNDSRPVLRKDINSLTKNNTVRSLLEAYADSNFLLVDDTEYAKMSDKHFTDYRKMLSGKDYNPLSQEEEKSLFRKYRDLEKGTEKRKIKDEIIKHNLRLVVSIAFDFKNANMEIMDLIEEGNCCLADKIDKFDPERGCKFSTYIIPWLKEEIYRNAYSKKDTIRKPLHIYGEIKRYNKFASEYREKHGKDFENSYTEKDLEKLSKMLDMSVDDIKIIMSMKYPVSLETPVGNEDEGRLGDFIMDSSISLEDSVMFEGIKESVNNIIDSNILNEREKYVIRRYYGFINNGKNETYDAISKELGVSCERARQIASCAIKKLRNNKKMIKIWNSFANDDVKEKILSKKA